MKIDIKELIEAHRYHHKKRTELIDEYCVKCANQINELNEYGEHEKAEGVLNALLEFLKSI